MANHGKTYMVQSKFQFLLNQDQQDEEEVQDIAKKVAELISEGLQVNKITSIESQNYNTTALHLASQAGNESMVFALLDDRSYQADAEHAKEAILRPDAKDEDTVIHVAALSGKLSIMVALFSGLPTNALTVMSNNNPPDWKNKWNHTPLHYALAKGNVEIARFLMQKGADVNAEDNCGAKGIHFAARGGSVECLQLVMNSQNLDIINQVSKAGLTALHYAAWNDKAAAVQWLLGNGAHLGVVDLVEGGMPLHWAVMRGRVSIETLQVLLEAHVKGTTFIFQNNKYGKNVLEVAEKHQEVGRGEVYTVLDAMDKAGLMEKKAGMTPPLVKYVMGYGNDEMNGKVAKIMVYSAELRRDSLITFLEANKIIEWAARKGNMKSVVHLVKLVRKIWQIDQARHKLKTALQVALYAGKFPFAEALVKYINHQELPNVIMNTIHHFQDEILRKVFQDLKDMGNDTFCCKSRLIEDIPFAYFVFYSKDDYEARHDIANFIGKYKAWDKIVNKHGNRHYRTALHWAVLLDRLDIVSELCGIKECRAIEGDETKKSPYRYAVEMKRRDLQKELLIRPDVRSYSDLLFRERSVYIDASHAMLVGAALIAGISFSGFLHLLPPLENSASKEGSVNTNKRGVQAFLCLNSLSFFSAMGTALVGAGGMLPMPDTYIRDVVRHIECTLRAAAIGLVLSIIFALAAFVVATDTVLPSYFRSGDIMIILSVIGGAICLAMLIWFCKGVLLMKSNQGVSSPPRELAPHECIPFARQEPGLETETISGVYEVGYFYSDCPWQDGLDLKEPSISAQPSQLSTGPAATEFSIDMERRPLLGR